MMGLTERTIQAHSRKVCVAVFPRDGRMARVDICSNEIECEGVMWSSLVVAGR